MYAAGEIILVVIGILIALTLNNRNEHQRDLAKEQVYLQQMIEDLRLQLAEIENQILSENIDSVAISRIVSAINEGFEGIDTVHLNDDLANSGDNRTFNVFSSTYGELKFTGNIALISNIELKQNINTYYQNLHPYEKVLNKNNSEDNRFRLEDFYRKKGVMVH